MGRIWSWIVAFGRFWYHFIVGDDWTVAAAVAVGPILTAILNSAHVIAWWLVRLIVGTMLGVSLRRAKKKNYPGIGSLNPALNRVVPVSGPNRTPTSTVSSSSECSFRCS